MSASSKKDSFLEVACYSSIITLGSIFYFHTLFFGFTYFDDSWFALDACARLAEAHFSLGSIFFQTLYPAFQADQFYRPLVWLSYLINAWFGGVHAFVYHLTNVILHLASACLVFGVFSAMRFARKPALLASFIFLIHPLQQQVAVSITGRNDSLLAIFVLCAFLVFLKFIEKPSTAWCILHSLMFFAALCVKENAVMLIPVCFVYCSFVSKIEISLRRDIGIMIGWIVALCAWFILRQIATQGSTQVSIFTMIVYMIRNVPAILLYLGNVLVPVDLSVWPTLRDSTLLYGVITISIMAVSLIMSRTLRKGYAFFGLGWFLFFLAPTLIRPNTGAMAYFLDQRMYLPMVGLLIFLLETDILRGINFKKARHAVPAVVCIGIFMFLSYTRGLDFQNSASFWENARRTSPHTWRAADDSVTVDVTVK